ncbi:MAG: hypothetical protein AAF804_20405 [Bacteroidota bacterium]
MASYLCHQSLYQGATALCAVRKAERSSAVRGNALSISVPRFEAFSDDEHLVP